MLARGIAETQVSWNLVNIDRTLKIFKDYFWYQIFVEVIINLKISAEGSFLDINLIKKTAWTWNLYRFTLVAGL